MLMLICKQFQIIEAKILTFLIIATLDFAYLLSFFKVYQSSRLNDSQ